MAAFSDQFDRVDPLQLYPQAGPLDLLVTVMSLDARSYLDYGRTANECKTICQILELEFQRHIGTEDPRRRSNLLVGDFDLLRKAMREEVDLICPELLKLAKPWEVYAILALWKIVDVCDILSRQTDLDKFERFDGRLEVNTDLIIAHKALQLAASKLASRLGEMRAHGDIDKRKADEGRVNVAMKWIARKNHLEFALSLVPGIKTGFRIESARKIAKAVNDKFGTSYRDTSVDRWLEKAGWARPNILTCK